MRKKLEKLIKKIPDVSGLVTTVLMQKKKDHDAKISEIERKYFHASDYNKFMSDIIDAKMKQQKTNKQTNKKSDISNPVKNSYLNLKT